MRQRRRNLVACLVIVAGTFLSAVQATYADFDDGMDAFQRRDYETALEEWQPLAEQGDARAQLEVGRLYISGNGVPQDDAEAVRWYRLAAEQGDAEAQSYLGGLHHQGRGVEQSYVEAAKWYRVSAEQGNAFSQLRLGWYYAYGKGVPRDRVLAYMWLGLVEEQGDDFHRQDARDLRGLVAEHMSEEQLEEAEVLTREWMAAHPVPDDP